MSIYYKNIKVSGGSNSSISSVEVEKKVTSGTEIADIKINGQSNIIYSPKVDCASYVIETGKFNSSDGTKHEIASENDSWYRLYSDGWCEQGGTHESANPIRNILVKLFKHYTNTSYNILLSRTVTKEEGMYPIYYYNKTTTQFIYDVYDSNWYGGNWKAEGFVS